MCSTIAMVQNPAALTLGECQQVRRAQALEMRTAGASFVAIGDAFGVTPARARQIFLWARRLATRPQWHNALPPRAVGFLRCEGVAFLPEAEAAAAVASRYTRKELKDQPNVGPGAYAALIDWMARHGLKPYEELIIRHKTGGPSQGRLFESSPPALPAPATHRAPHGYAEPPRRATETRASIKEI
jgi:hypothetical protein